MKRGVELSLSTFTKNILSVISRNPLFTNAAELSRQYIKPKTPTKQTSNSSFNLDGHFATP